MRDFNRSCADAIEELAHDARAITGMRGGDVVRVAGQHFQRRSTIAYVRKAGVLYSWGLRQLVLIAPVLAFILHPVAGLIAAFVVGGVLFSLDRSDPRLESQAEARRTLI